MERLHNKLDAIAVEISDIKVLLAKNTVVLDRNVDDVAVHIRRTDLLEKQVQKALLPTKLLAAVTALVVVVGPLLAILQALGLLHR